MKYFLHDSSAFEDEKITELHMKFRYEGIGLFFTILEKLAFQEKPIKTNVLKNQLRVGKKLEKVWDFLEQIELISSNNGETFNEQLLNFSEKYQIKKEKNRKRISQWRDNQLDKENVTRYESVRNAPKGKESKEKESVKENLPLSDFEISEEEKEQSYSDYLNANASMQTNFNRKPVIPTKMQVWEVFCRAEPNEELAKKMAKAFYEKYEALGWYYKNSPIVGFHNLVPSFVGTWREIEANKIKKPEQSLPPQKKLYDMKEIIRKREEGLRLSALNDPIIK